MSARLGTHVPMPMHVHSYHHLLLWHIYIHTLIYICRSAKFSNCNKSDVLDSHPACHICNCLVNPTIVMLIFVTQSVSLQRTIPVGFIRCIKFKWNCTWKEDNIWLMDRWTSSWCCKQMTYQKHRLSRYTVKNTRPGTGFIILSFAKSLNSKI